MCNSLGNGPVSRCHRWSMGIQPPRLSNHFLLLPCSSLRLSSLCGCELNQLCKGLVLQKTSAWESFFLSFFQSNAIRRGMPSAACERPSSPSENAAALGGHGLGPGASSTGFASRGIVMWVLDIFCNQSPACTEQ